jgi:hypothetical protein
LSCIVFLAPPLPHQQAKCQVANKNADEQLWVAKQNCH